MLKKSEKIRDMFSKLANRYDLLNTVMTFGHNRLWTRLTVKEAGVCGKARLLDIGTGTGKIAKYASLKNRSLFVIAADFSADMMLRGKDISFKNISWCASDALVIPFADNCFDAVTSGYLMRNTEDILKAFKEQLRVLCPGGKVVCLETSVPPKNFWRPFIRFYIDVVIPCMGALISGKGRAYRYLAKSSKNFKDPDSLAQTIRKAGFETVEYKRFMCGTIAIHTAIKPCL